jgi:hypothetical protein
MLIDQASSSKVKDGYACKFLKGKYEKDWSALGDDFRTFLLTPPVMVGIIAPTPDREVIV